MTVLQAAGELCRSPLWQRIDGWEVVLTAVVIVIVWGVVQVARLYFVAAAAMYCPRCNPGHNARRDDDA